jgi:hypothetical protein
VKGEKQVQEHPEWLVALGHVAHKLGFQSEMITTLSQQDAELSQIRTHMREERPSSEYLVSSVDFDLQARSRQEGQIIFKPRPSLPSPLMTSDDNIATGTIKSHHGLFLPTIWDALSQEARFALTDFGSLLLSLISFYGEFSPNHTNSTPNERIHPTTPMIATQSLLGCVAPAAGSLTRRRSSTLPDASGTASMMFRSSSVYSIPVHPAMLEESSAGAQFSSIAFWLLPTRRGALPTLEHRCEASKHEIMKLVRNISAKDTPLLFMLLDRDGRFKLCAPSQILYRRKQSKKPNDVYYGNENRRVWIMKTLGNIHPS